MVEGDFDGWWRETAVTRARKTRVATAVKSIKDFYALGRQIPPKRSPRDAYGQGDLTAAAEKLGVSVELARQARQFADRGAGYTREELDELCDLIRQAQPHQADDLPVFGRTHVVRLLTVPKGRRAKLQRAAVEGGWSSNRLAYEVGVRFGPRRHGGRRRRLPADDLGVLTQAEQFCESWRRWVGLLTPDPEQQEAKTKAASLDALPARVRRLVREADAAMAKLHGAATDELKARRPGRAVRHQFQKVETEGGGRR
jgi:hypothetical protein